MKKVKILIGGSPCTHWSIAQRNNRETEPTGLGYELFKNFLIAKEKFQPDFFLYENNKSASQAIKNQIHADLGGNFHYINSSLVSAQNRQRFYVTNIPNVTQPKDRGILLKDILETTSSEKCYELSEEYYKGALKTNLVGSIKNDGTYKNGKSKQVSQQYRVYTSNDKSICLNTGGQSTNGHYMVCDKPLKVGNIGSDSQGNRVYSENAKSVTLTANGGGQGAKTGLYAISKGLSVGNINPSGKGMNGEIIHIENKSRCLTTNKGEGQKIIYPAKPINTCVDGKARTIIAGYDKMGSGNLITNKGFHATGVAERVNIETPTGAAEQVVGRKANEDGTYDRHYELRNDQKSACITSVMARNMVCEELELDEPLIVKENTKKGYTEIYPTECVDLDFPNSKTRRGRKMEDKSNCLQTSNEHYQYLGTTDKPVYEVESGMITIKGKQYPIKLKDGKYIIRKLTVTECERLQTVPDGYCRAVSKSQAYKGLGNGWTAEVIIHILKHMNLPLDTEIEVLSMYDGIGTGRYCFDKMGYKNIKYIAYEIDKFAMQVSMSNYPDIIQMGDAFDVRNDDWLEKMKGD